MYVDVLDNESSLDNFRALQRGLATIPSATLTRGAENAGFGNGVNRLSCGRQIRDTDILWILNPDTKLLPGCLDALVAEIQTGHFGIVSPLICSGDPTSPWIWYCGGSVDNLNVRAEHHLYGRAIADAPQQTFETSFVTGAAPMMRAETFREIGGFPEDYFLYWEDAYLSWKARGLGIRLGVVPTAHLWHHVGASSGSSQSEIFYFWFTRNRLKYARDVSIPTRQLMFGTGGVESLRPIARAILREHRGRLPKTRAAILGTISGFKGSFTTRL